MLQEKELPGGKDPGGAFKSSQTRLQGEDLGGAFKPSQTGLQGEGLGGGCLQTKSDRASGVGLQGSFGCFSP